MKSPLLVYENLNIKKVILVSWNQWILWKVKRPWWGSRGTKLSKQETSCIKCKYDCSPQTNSVLGPSESGYYYKLICGLSHLLGTWGQTQHEHLSSSSFLTLLMRIETFWCWACFRIETRILEFSSRWDKTHYDLHWARRIRLVRNEQILDTFKCFFYYKSIKCSL